jgi:hypothetical protein
MGKGGKMEGGRVDFVIKSARNKIVDIPFAGEMSKGENFKSRKSNKPKKIESN